MHRHGYDALGSVLLLQGFDSGSRVGAVYTLLAGKVLDKHILLCLNANGTAKALVGIYLVAGCKATCGHGHAKYDMMEFHCVCFC